MKIHTRASSDRRRYNSNPNNITFNSPLPNDPLNAFSSVSTPTTTQNHHFTFSCSIHQKTWQKTPKTKAFLSQIYTTTTIFILHEKSCQKNRLCDVKKTKKQLFHLSMGWALHDSLTMFFLHPPSFFKNLPWCGLIESYYIKINIFVMVQFCYVLAL